MSTIRDVLTAARAMQALQEDLRRTVDFQSQLTDSLAGLRNFESQITSLSRRMLDYQLTIASTMRPITSALALPAFDVSRSIAAMLEDSRPKVNFNDTIAKVTADWQRMFKALDAANVRHWMPVKTHMAKLYELSATSFSSLQTINLGDIGLKLRLDDSARKALIDSHVNFGAEYLAFFKDITQNEIGIVELPQALTELPAVEYLNQTALVASTSGGNTEAEADEAISQVQSEYAAHADDKLVELLNKFNRDLTDLLLGARAAIESKHADYVRHFAASYRELFTHVLHLLAPDDLVGAWTKDPDDYHNGRPTRKARLRYITRELQQNFGGFLNADVNSVITFIDSFQKGTHAIRPGFAPKDVLDLKTRMEGLLLLLLVVNARPW